MNNKKKRDPPKQPPDELSKTFSKHMRTAKLNNDGLQNICRVCGKKTKVLCSGCRVARYCSRAHQKMDWGEKGGTTGHRIECKAAQKAKKEIEEQLKKTSGTDAKTCVSVFSCVAVSIDLREIFSPQQMANNDGRF